MQSSTTTYEQNKQDTFLDNGLKETVEANEEALTDEIYETESANDNSDIQELALDSESDKDDSVEDMQVIEETQIDKSEDSSAAELEDLRDQIKTLKAELERTKRLEAELLDFTEVFPEQDVRAIPDEVWQDVRKGNSLAAAFALFERKKANVQARAAEVNQINAYRSSGRAGSDAANEFFSPDDVRAMSQSEVRANYSRIIESMKKWN